MQKMTITISPENETMIITGKEWDEVKDSIEKIRVILKMDKVIWDGGGKTTINYNKSKIVEGLPHSEITWKN